MYDYFKQVSRHRHQYGNPQGASFIPLDPLEDVGIVPAYRASVDAVIPDLNTKSDSTGELDKRDKKSIRNKKQLPPLDTRAAAESVGKIGQAVGGGLEENDGDAKYKDGLSKRMQEAGEFAQVRKKKCLPSKELSWEASLLYSTLI